jgi:hypothetical protein
MYYKGSIEVIRNTIEKAAPGTEAVFVEPDTFNGELAPLSYLLWMCDELQSWDTASVDMAVRAGRWMGWIGAHLELHGLITNEETQNMIREDRKNGFDKPH